jgi:hypothetical protein
VEQDPAAPIQSQERPKAFTLKEIKDEIKMLNQKKAPGLDLITAKMLKELPKEEFVNLMHIFSAILRLEYWPKSLKIAQITMIFKPGKKFNGRFILPTNQLTTDNFKILEKPILKKINKDLNPQDWIPDHQFAFRQAHSSVQQCHRITDIFNKAKEHQQYLQPHF